MCQQYHQSELLQSTASNTTVSEFKSEVDTRLK